MVATNLSSETHDFYPLKRMSIPTLVREHYVKKC